VLESVLYVRELERLPRHSGVDEGVLTLHVPELEARVELLVLLGQRELLLCVEVAIALQRGLAAVVQEGLGPEIHGPLPAEKREEHGLVVPDQEDAVVLLAQLEQPIHHAPRVGSSIHVVADEDEPVARLQG
jgi:hypothetical protein